MIWITESEPARGKDSPIETRVAPSFAGSLSELPILLELSSVVKSFIVGSVVTGIISVAVIVSK